MISVLIWTFYANQCVLKLMPHEGIYLDIYSKNKASTLPTTNPAEIVLQTKTQCMAVMQ